MNYSTISDYFKYPAKVAELRQRLYQILISKGVEVSANESLNSLIEKVKSIEGTVPEETIYITDNGTYDVTNYARAEVDVQAVAPENELDFLIDNTISHFTMPSRVNEIGEYKFYKCYDLSQVSIGNGTNIPDYAFYQCYKLESITMPYCKAIGSNAFYNCSSLSVAAMPTAYTIGESAFAYCGLTAFSNSQVLSLNSYTFYNNSSLSDISLSNVYTINDNVFTGCVSLSSLYIPNLVLAGISNFNNVSDLRTISFNNLTSIKGGGLISNNSYISEINLPTLKHIGGLRTSEANPSYFIQSCPNLTSLNLPNLSVINGGLIANSPLLSEINLPLLNSFNLEPRTPDNVYQSFVYQMSGLKSINLPILESGGMGYYPTSYLINGCPNLENINVSRVTYIPSSFLYSTKVSEFIVPCASELYISGITYNSMMSKIDIRAVSTINYGGLSENVNLEELKYFELENVSTYGMYNCQKISQIGLAKPLISAFAFAKCTNLENIYLNTYSTVSSINTDTAFTNTPITNSNLLGHYGSIYVHPDKLSMYSASPLSSRFTAFSNDYLNENIVAFRYMNNGLTTMPQGLESTKNIYKYAFSGNTNLNAELNFSMLENVGTGAFYGCGKLKVSNLGNVEYIGNSAFYNCYSISNLSLPSVKYIMSSAFYNNSSLSLVYAPNCLYVGSGAFGSCKTLSNINLDSAEYIGKYAFYNTALSLINLPNAKYIMPNAFYHYNINNSVLLRVSAPNVEYVGSNAFYGNYSNQMAYLPNAKVIEQSAFWYNYSLSDLTIPNCTYVGDNAFRQCTSIPNLSNENIRYIGTYAFNSCSSLSQLYLPECRYIGNSAFDGCKKLSELYIPNVRYIGARAFANTSLTSFEMSRYVDMAQGTFANCSYLENANIDYQTYIYAYTFDSCSRLINVNMPSAKRIYEYAFRNCQVLSSISISSLEYIENGAFTNCYNLTIDNLDFSKCSYIGSLAFNKCSSITSFSNSLITSLYSSTFADCRNLSHVNLPNVSTIGEYNFFNCYSLSSLIINYSALKIVNSYTFQNCSLLQFDSNAFSNVTSIGINAFTGCTNLSNLNLPLLTHIGSSAFSETGLTEISASQVTILRSATFRNCYNLSIASLDNCSFIEAYAFADCSTLSDIYLPNLKEIGLYAFTNTAIRSIPELLASTSKSMPAGAFKGCSNLESANLKVCEIVGNSIFENCTSLSYVSMPICNEIGSSAFKGCTNLQEVYIPMLSEIKNGIFEGCTSLETINLPLATVSDSYYGQYAFRNCYALQSVSLNNLDFVPYYMFYGCSNLNNISIPNCSVIYSSAFQNCISLHSINLPNCLIIYPNAFYDCGALTNVNANYLTSVSGQAFYQCSNLESINAPIITTINNGGFQNCYKLKSIIYGGSYRLNPSIFYNCSSLESVYITNAYRIGQITNYSLSSVFGNTPILNSTYLGYYGSIYVPSERLDLVRNAYSSISSERFQEMPASIASLYVYGNLYESLSTTLSEINYSAKYILSNAFNSATITDGNTVNEISFPNCTYIGQSAFANCSSLTLSLNLSQVKLVGSYAFLGCSTLENINLENAEYIDAYAFSGCTNLSSVYMPKVKTINGYAFYKCSSLTELNISNDISFNGTSGFGQCINLSSINLTGRVLSITVGTFADGGNITYFNMPSCSLVYAAQNQFLKLSNNVSYLYIDGLMSVYTQTFSRPAITYIESMILPSCYYIAGNALSGLTINNLDLPNYTNASVGNAFNGLSIETLKLSNLASIRASYAMGNISAKNIVLDNLTYIQASYAFAGCTKLEKLVLTMDSVPSMYSANNLFASTPIVASSYLGYFGSIYIPASLYGSYTLASFWSGFANRYAIIEEHASELRALGLID